MTALLALWAHGEAAAYTTTLCARVSNNFDEKANVSGTWIGFGNLWRRESEPKVPLRGVLMNVVSYDPNGVFSGNTLYDAPADASGCKSFTTHAGYSYLMYVKSAAAINGVDVQVYPSESSNTPYVWVKTFSSSDGRYHPFASTTLYIEPNLDPEWAALAVGAQAMYRNNGGIDSCGCSECGSLKFANTSTNANGGGNGSYQEHIIVSTRRKYLLAHEIGHAVVRRRDECLTPVDEWDAPSHVNCDATVGWDGSSCSPTGSAVCQDGLLAPEWQSVALKEGFADFYSAWLWNSRDDACEICPTNGPNGAGDDPTADLDKDGDADYDPDLFPAPDCWRVDCEGTPQDYPGMLIEPYITQYDWLENLLDHPNAGNEQCSQPLASVGSSYDVTRYLWDMYTDQGVELSTLIDLYDRSDPHDWAGRSVAQAPYDAMPFQRWLRAIYDHYPQLLDEHNAEKQNGLDHGPGPT